MTKRELRIQEQEAAVAADVARVRRLPEVPVGCRTFDPRRLRRAAGLTPKFQARIRAAKRRAAADKLELGESRKRQQEAKDRQLHEQSIVGRVKQKLSRWLGRGRRQ